MGTEPAILHYGTTSLSILLLSKDPHQTNKCAFKHFSHGSVYTASSASYQTDHQTMCWSAAVLCHLLGYFHHRGLSVCVLPNARSVWSSATHPQMKGGDSKYTKQHCAWEIGTIDVTNRPIIPAVYHRVSYSAKSELHANRLTLNRNFNVIKSSIIMLRGLRVAPLPFKLCRPGPACPLLRVLALTRWHAGT